jgi:hypothetical protein
MAFISKGDEMQGTMLDFLKLATEKPQLAKELVELAEKYDFQFDDEVSDDQLEGVSGGASVKVIMSSLTGGGLPDGLGNPLGSTPSSSPGPIPYPNTGGSQSDGVGFDGSGTSDGVGTTQKEVI